MFYGDAMFIGNSHKRYIYLLRLIAVSHVASLKYSENLVRFTIAADTLMIFAGENFYRGNRRQRVAIMFKGPIGGYVEVSF